MTYIGQQPATTFDSGIQDRFTGLTTNTVTLNHEISAEEDILVVWNNIVQDKNTYSVGGTGNKTVTLGGTLVSGDVVTVYYLNKVMQSVNPTAGSVNTTQLADTSITAVKLNTAILTGQTDIGADIADADLFLVDDGAGGTVRKSAASRLKTYIGDNTPAFLVAQSSNQSISNTTNTTLTFGTEHVDTDSAFASNKFTVPSGQAGLYVFTLTVQGNGNMGGSGGGVTICRYDSSDAKYTSGGGDADGNLNQSISSVNGYALTVTYKMLVGDYVNAAIYQASGSTQTTYAPRTFFGGHKLIGT